MIRRKQTGQSSVEYALIGGVLVWALLVADVASGESAAQMLVNAIKSFFRGLTFFISLP